MSNLKKNYEEMSAKQQENLAGYNQMIMKNYDASTMSTKPTGYDPSSIAEKVKNLKFAKLAPKDTDWFSKLNSTSTVEQNSKNITPKKLRNGLTEDDERKIAQEMIP